MYQVIARKYRPQAFDELVSQEHVKTTIENAISQGRIAHGYIFSGQRGTGKTTVARIFARCLNCEQGPTAKPCGKCASCTEIASGSAIDVIEIDAASNRGINEMRELRESVRFRPARDRFKVFIIDEAHQITNEAFNALLKTLEEPPELVVFILCTTESHKIPVTIQSRCQQFSFRSVDFGALVERMEWIAKQEGITADPEVLSVLAQAGEGSVRDSLSALDQAIACCGTTLNAGEVRSLLGMFSLDSLDQVAKALSANDPQKMLEVVAELEANGRSLQHFARELARYFRNLLVARIAGGQTRLIAASPSEQQKLVETAKPFSEEDLTRYLQLTLDLFRDLQSSLQPRLHLEMGLLRMVHAGKLLPIEQALAGLTGGTAAMPSAGMTGGTGSSSLKSAGAAPSIGFGAPARRVVSASTVPASTAVSSPAPVSSFTTPPFTPAAPTHRSSAPAAATPSQTSSVPASGDLRSRLHAALLEAKLTHLADALEHADLTESANDLIFTTPKMYQLYLKQAEFEAAAKKIAGRPVRVTVKVGEVARARAAALDAQQNTAAAPAALDDTAVRALENPEVKRFQEMFPDAQVRTVRNLRDR